MYYIIIIIRYYLKKTNNQIKKIIIECEVKINDNYDDDNHHSQPLS